MSCATLGCNPSQPTGDREATVSAGGTLTHQGQPLAYYQVLLTPQAPQRPAAGTTDEHGKFTLGTNAPGDGAVVGSHRVAVVFVGPPGSGGDGMNDFAPPPAPKLKLPAKYGNAEKSGISVEIPAGGDRELKIDLP
ncbi:hypothetical protein [Planctellipticum variicoloris]|uniref:hypothetical protein n=1 Tax=Planctellipticum variicoloris TaxID=3064265 RepID=UPI003013D8AE|nr:hypothetical protein SH412_002230 [Planctomycetaceae bacterium SH412]